MSEPVRAEVVLPCPPEKAFELFTRRFDAWWPPKHRTIAGSRIAVDGLGVGGRIVERGADGAERVFGVVLAWRPPEALTFTWTLGAAPGRPTKVDVAFVAVGSDQTRVKVVHSEADSGLGDQWPDRARLFDASWRHVLPALAAYAAEAR